MAEEIKTKNSNVVSQLIKIEPSLFVPLKVGELVEGVVLEKVANTLFLDLGRHGTGVVYKGETQNAKDLVRELKSGDRVHSKVIEVDNEDGYVELSLAEAGKQKAWAEVVELEEKEEVFAVKITGCNKGGLVAQAAGLGAFLPVSQLSSEHYAQVVSGEKTETIKILQKMIGQEFTVKIIEANPRSNKLIISERAALEAGAKELVKGYTVGQVIEGVVLGVADFGAFVRFTDNPVVEGLIHVSELDHRLVANPKEVVSVDDAVKAKIIEIKDGKIYLSLKALKPDPWETVTEKYKEGQEVSGTVYVLNPFGALIALDEDIQGQLHVSEFGSVEEMKKQLSLGKEYPFVIDSIKVPEKRIVLKLKK